MKWFLSLTTALLVIAPTLLTAEDQDKSRVGNNRGPPNRKQRPFWQAIGNRRNMQQHGETILSRQQQQISPTSNPVNFVPQRNPNRDHRCEFLNYYHKIFYEK